MFKSQRVLELILFFAVLGLYIHNLGQSIYAGDTGLLVSAVVTHGIAHPPGYPLFTLLGSIFIELGVFTHQSPAFLVGLVSVFASAFAGLLYFRISILLTNKVFLSLVSTFVLITTYLFWFFAEIPEVFALNNLFILLLIYLAILYSKNPLKKYIYTLALVSGLALANHLTIILLYPALVIIIWPKLLSEFRKQRTILFKLAIFTLVGLAPYLYIIIASLLHPAIDWAHIKDIHSFMAFVTRERYGTFQAGYFDSPGVINRLATLLSYLMTLSAQLTLPVILLSLTAIFKIIISRQRIGIAFLVGFLLLGPFFMYYAGFPLDNTFRVGLAERFMTASAVLLMLFFPLGLDYFTSILGKLFNKPFYVTLFVGIFLLIPIQLFVYNYPKTNLSKVTIGDDLGINYLSPLPINSILLLASDTSLFNTLYQRYALNFRADVAVLNAVDPGDTNTALSKLSGDVTLPALSKEQSVALLRNIESIDNKYPVFSEVPFKGNPKITWVPYGLVYELRRADEPVLTSEQFSSRTNKIWSKLRVPIYTKNPSAAYHNLSLAAIYNTYAWALWHTGVYSVSTYSNYPDYSKYMVRSLSVYPDFHPALASLGTFALSVAHDCPRSIFDYKQALEKDPYNKFYFKLLATGERECHTDNKEISELQLHYKKLFNADLFGK